MNDKIIHIISLIKCLTFREKLEVLKELINELTAGKQQLEEPANDYAVSRTKQEQLLEAAAKLLNKDYSEDKELTTFTIIDPNDYFEEG
ncbi:MAG: hypothetical protein Kow0027_00870 [Saprospiraceae bacterium]